MTICSSFYPMGGNLSRKKFPEWSTNYTLNQRYNSFSIGSSHGYQDHWSEYTLIKPYTSGSKITITLNFNIPSVHNTRTNHHIFFYDKNNLQIGDPVSFELSSPTTVAYDVSTDVHYITVYYGSFYRNTQYAIITNIAKRDDS